MNDHMPTERRIQAINTFRSDSQKSLPLHKRFLVWLIELIAKWL
jgi:hypothetical protein